MGNTSSMLTQYDIEEVQEHCNHTCMCVCVCILTKPLVKSASELIFGSSDNLFVHFLDCKLVSLPEIASLYRRFCQLDRNGGGFISAEEFLSVPEFAVNPLSQVQITSVFFFAFEVIFMGFTNVFVQSLINLDCQLYVLA